jgi:hypothetical protein
LTKESKSLLSLYENSEKLLTKMEARIRMVVSQTKECCNPTKTGKWKESSHVEPPEGLLMTWCLIPAPGEWKKIMIN